MDVPSLTGAHIALANLLMGVYIRPPNPRGRDMRVSFAVGAATAALVACCAVAGPARAAGDKIQPLNQYVVTGGDREDLAAQGFDLTEGRLGTGGGQGIVATPEQADKLRARGFTVTAPFGEMQRSFAPPNPFPT